MIESGKTVKVHYKGTLADGNTFDSSEGRDPMAFELGAEQVIPGFEAAVAEMEIGETKTINLPCAEAYGEHRDEMLGAVPRSSMPEDIELEIGMVLSMESEQGAMPVRVMGFDDEKVDLDANHPLAGEDLTFELTLVEVE
ncbi:MAG: peptidylprolyl isomerase [bacterium]|nr:peptidylprolyl isomerase [bacterium]